MGNAQLLRQLCGFLASVPVFTLPSPLQAVSTPSASTPASRQTSRFFQCFILIGSFHAASVPAAPDRQGLFVHDIMLPGKKQGRCLQTAAALSGFYFAYSTARLSRMTLTLIWPG